MESKKGTNKCFAYISSDIVSRVACSPSPVDLSYWVVGEHAYQANIFLT